MNLSPNINKIRKWNFVPGIIKVLPSFLFAMDFKERLRIRAQRPSFARRWGKRFLIGFGVVGALVGLSSLGPEVDQVEYQLQEKSRERDLTFLSPSDPNLEIQWGVSSIQGRRPHMEDRFSITRWPTLSVFGVYDGHGGSITSTFVSRYLDDTLFQNFQASPLGKKTSSYFVHEFTFFK
jgi:hypothetical protein